MVLQCIVRDMHVFGITLRWHCVWIHWILVLPIFHTRNVCHYGVRKVKKKPAPNLRDFSSLEDDGYPCKARPTNQVLEHQLWECPNQRSPRNQREDKISAVLCISWHKNLLVIDT
mmetsp:Transcript_13325/g.31998  ORF Transcript_13325/g.31998 Transcript_13325/m.31998 type:complete len:115 (-) Transcript_13325:1277-1621(-)